MVANTAIIEALTPANPVDAENDAFQSLVAEFDSEQDARKIDYLKHRYAGFTRKESATITGVKASTANKWIKEDPRVARFDELVSTGKRKELRKDVLQEEWFKNFYLVIKKDAYIIRKAHGLLEEPYLEIKADGTRVQKMGSPSMLKADWDYFAQMRKMYTPDAWASIEKVISGQGGQFNIDQFVLNLAQNQQINVGPERV